MKTFCNWNKDWQQPSKHVRSRVDPILEERLRKKFLGIKLIYSEKLFWLHSVRFHKKMGNNIYYLNAIN